MFESASPCPYRGQTGTPTLREKPRRIDGKGLPIAAQVCIRDSDPLRCIFACPIGIQGTAPPAGTVSSREVEMGIPFILFFRTHPRHA